MDLKRKRSWSPVVKKKQTVEAEESFDRSQVSGTQIDAEQPYQE